MGDMVGMWGYRWGLVQRIWTGLENMDGGYGFGTF